MYRAIILCVILVAGLVIIGAIVGANMLNSNAESRNQEVDDAIADLQTQRIALLEKRLEITKRSLTSSAFEKRLQHPQLDLLYAKLEYAKSEERRTQLYNQLLEFFDKQIELAKLAVDDPAVASSAETESNLAHYYFLQSERLRIQIEFLELP